jgi:hypothetical protein
MGQIQLVVYFLNSKHLILWIINHTPLDFVWIINPFHTLSAKTSTVNCAEILYFKDRAKVLLPSSAFS